MADVSILYKGSAISEFSSSLTKKVNTKGKYCEDDITIVYTKPITPTYSIELQSKTVTYTPSTSTQTETITADTGYDGLSSVGVTVNPIPSEYVIPSGTKSITENGTYDVAAFASAIINVASSGGSGLEYDAGTFTLTSDYGGGTGSYSIPHNLGEIPAVIIVWTDYFDDETHTTTKNSNIGYVYLRGFSALPQRLSKSATSSGGLAAIMTINSGERKVFFGNTSSGAYMPQNQQPTATDFKLNKKQGSTSTYWIGGITYNYIVIKKWW